MGKGDKKTKKGKIAQGSYGVTRKRKKSTPIVASAKPKAKVATKKAEEKAETVKPAAKKTATAEKKPAAAKKPAAKKTTTKSTSKKEA